MDSDERWNERERARIAPKEDNDERQCGREKIGALEGDIDLRQNVGESHKADCTDPPEER